MMSSMVDRAAGLATRIFPVEPIDILPPGRILELAGRGSTFVTDSGDPDAPAIILLHSVMTTGLLCWYQSIPLLSKDFRVITVDQRFHGHGIESDTFDMGDCADDVVAVADALGIGTFIAAGFSLGGGVAQLCWRRHPDRVAGLVLCSTGPFFSGSRSRHPRLTQVTRGFIDGALSLIPSVQPAPIDERGTSSGAWALRQFRSTRLSRLPDISAGMADFYSEEWLSEITVPTAVVISTKDRTVPPARQQILVDKIPTARRFDVAGGHACCVLEAQLFTPVLHTACRAVAEDIVTPIPG